jgi:hypothetical protein
MDRPWLVCSIAMTAMTVTVMTASQTLGQRRRGPRRAVGLGGRCLLACPRGDDMGCLLAAGTGTVLLAP